MKLGIWYAVNLAAIVGMAFGIPGCGRAAGSGTAVNEVGTRAVHAIVSPLELRPFARTTLAGPLRGWIAQVHTVDSLVEIVVTGAIAPEPPSDGHPAGEARLERTRDWARRMGVDLAVNANFFSKVRDPLRGYRVGVLSDIIGLCVSDGVQVSPVRCAPELPACDPAVLFAPDGRARALNATGEDAASAWDAVAGVASMLIDDGVNLGAAARVEPSIRHPRTALGVSRDGATLWVVVIDGRQTAWSIGMTLSELADLFIELGAWDAVNLDGGGSTEMVVTGELARAMEGEGTLLPGGVRVLNRPSERGGRPVANHLGVRVR